MARRLLLTILAGLWFATLAGYLNATAMPIVRHAAIVLPGYPPDAPPMRLLLMSDLHVSAPDTTPARLARVVTLANAQAPDLVLIDGDLTSDKIPALRHYDFPEAVAPLAGLRARAGVIAVLGNNDWDHRRGRAAQRALEDIGIVVLRNSARRVGPIAIGGLDDALTGHGDLPRTLAAIGRAGGAGILIAHTPWITEHYARLPGLILSGHTHCSQIVLPLIGQLDHLVMRKTAPNPCGIGRFQDAAQIVTAGIGTSIVPLRFGAHPDMWVVTVGPAPAAPRH